MPFLPPFCPNSSCKHHFARRPQARWWMRKGFFPTKREGPIQRFVCRSCGKTFSSQTFSVHYFVKKRIDLRRVFRSINSASGVRDIAREFGVTDKVILNRLSRLARQAIGMSASMRRGFHLREDLVADGFESFVYSQYFPNNFTILVGADSQFLYLTDYAQMNRKGRMTAGQKRHRERLRRRFPIEPGQIASSFGRIVRSAHAWWAQSPGKPSLTLDTDRKREYVHALAHNPAIRGAMESGRFIHRQTDSSAPRTLANPLMAVNYFDREIRKDQANHCRQTLQWSKDVNRSMERMVVYGAYHNFFKRFRIKDSADVMHAEVAGFSRREIERHRRRFFTRRYFIDHLKLEESEWRTWFGVWKSPTKAFRVDVPVSLAA
jgi:transposase-like protein